MKLYFICGSWQSYVAPFSKKKCEKSKNSFNLFIRERSWNNLFQAKAWLTHKIIDLIEVNKIQTF